MNLKILDNYEDNDLKKFKEIKNNSKLHNISDVALRVLYNRGINSVEKIEKHLFSNVKDFYDPFLLPDSKEFCKIVASSIKNNEHIVNYTDYDCDGIGSSITIMDGINKLIQLENSNATISWYANDRFIEGYGMTVNGILDLVEKYPDVGLIITTDNGILSFDAVKKCIELGIKVVITDHHRPDIKNGVENVPDALAVVNPHRLKSQYPFKEICGAGVAFKLMLALASYMNYNPEMMYSLLDVVAMSTIGDMVPLLDENRIFVKEGIKLIKQESRPAFYSLRKGLELAAKMKGKTRIVTVDEELLGFTYCPMLNSLGRLNGNIDIAMELFLSDNEEYRDKLVQCIISNNENRKAFTEEQTAIAINYVDSLEKIPDVIVVYHDLFMDGIVGLIAGRLKEKYNRPTVVFAKNGNHLKGSARSIDGVDMIQSLLNLGENLFLSCGGHAGAAGLSIREVDFKKFNEAINSEIVLTEKQKELNIYIDTAISAEDISEKIIDSLEILKPFGQKFEKPKFGIKSFYADPVVTGNPYKGVDKSTIRLVNNQGLTIIMFKHPEAFSNIEYKFEKNMEIKCVGYPTINVFNNKVSLQVQVENGLLF